VDDHDDNIFDEDDALDYIMYAEVEKVVNDPQSRSGCLGMLLVLIIPVVFVKWLATSVL
jgi:hypothetical protein